MVQMPSPPLAQQPNQRVLIVEDDPLIATMMEDIMEDMGLTVIGPAGKLEEALALAANAGIDIALIDIHIQGGEAYPVAEALAERGIPFAFSTGSDTESLPEKYRSTPTLLKPFLQEEVQQVLAELLFG